MKILTLAGAALGIALFTSGVSAQSCALYKDMKAALSGDKFTEAPLFSGMTKDRTAVFELWHNKETGTWSILRVTGKIACLMVVGEGGITINPPAPAKFAPTKFDKHA